MSSDVFVDIDGKNADDRSAASNHTRAKVILSHVAWLLQQKGVKEVGDVVLGEEGYLQRFIAPVGIPIEIGVTPKEPAGVIVMVRTVPAMRFKVDTIGDEGKTMDISVLSQRVADGVWHLASAIRKEKPKSDPPIDGDGDPKNVPRNELNPNSAHAGRPSATKMTKPDSGTVTNQVKERSKEIPIGKKEPKTKDKSEDDEQKIMPAQIVAQLTSLWRRIKDFALTEKLEDLVLKTLYYAKKSDWKKTSTALFVLQDSIQLLAKDKDKRGQLNLLWKECFVIKKQLSTVRDARKILVRDGELNSDVDRLRAIAKPESAKAPFMAGGSGSFIGARNRTASEKRDSTRRRLR